MIVKRLLKILNSSKQTFVQFNDKYLQKPAKSDSYQDLHMLNFQIFIDSLEIVLICFVFIMFQYSYTTYI